MPYDGSVWDETQPTQSTLANTIDSITRDVKIGVRSRLANEHNWPSAQTGTGSAGQHIFVSLQLQTGMPAFPLVGTTTQDGILYSSSGLGLSYATYNTAGYNVQAIAVYANTVTQGALLIGQSGNSNTLKVLASPAASSGGPVYALISNGTTADPSWGFPGGSMGTWTSRTIGTTYQATTDGIVTAYANRTDGAITMQGLTDSASTPTTVRSIGNANQNTFVNVCFPVKKGDYYVVNAPGTLSGAFMYFMPLGS